MTIKEKISRFTELGGKIIIKTPYHEENRVVSKYNEILLDPYLEEERVDHILDIMIKSLEEKPWLRFIEEINKKE